MAGAALFAISAASFSTVSMSDWHTSRLFLASSEEVWLKIRRPESHCCTSKLRVGVSDRQVKDDADVVQLVGDIGPDELAEAVLLAVAPAAVVHRAGGVRLLALAVAAVVLHTTVNATQQAQRGTYAPLANVGAAVGVDELAVAVAPAEGPLALVDAGKDDAAGTILVDAPGAHAVEPAAVELAGVDHRSVGGIDELALAVGDVKLLLALDGGEDTAGLVGARQIARELVVIGARPRPGESAAREGRGVGESLRLTRNIESAAVTSGLVGDAALILCLIIRSSQRRGRSVVE